MQHISRKHILKLQRNAAKHLGSITSARGRAEICCHTPNRPICGLGVDNEKRADSYIHSPRSKLGPRSNVVYWRTVKTSVCNQETTALNGLSQYIKYTFTHLSVNVFYRVFKTGSVKWSITEHIYITASSLLLELTLQKLQNC